MIEEEEPSHLEEIETSVREEMTDVREEILEETGTLEEDFPTEEDLIRETRGDLPSPVNLRTDRDLSLQPERTEIGEREVTIETDPLHHGRDLLQLHRQLQLLENHPDHPRWTGEISTLVV